MRIFLTVAGRTGHITPLLPFARNLLARGHAVTLAVAPYMVDRTRSMGFAAVGVIGESEPSTSRSRSPLQPFDEIAQREAVRREYCDAVVRRRFEPLLSLASRLRPDLVLCEELDYAGMLVAERLGLPFATVLLIATGVVTSPSWIAPALDPVRLALGFDTDPELAMPRRHLVLSPFPACFGEPSSAETQQRYRPGGNEPLEKAPRAGDASRKRIYATLGTDFNTRSGDLFERMLAGLAKLDADTILAVGRNVDPSTLGVYPANVTVEQFVDQARVISRCDLVVSHGGSGTMLDTLIQGLPSLLVPIAADQPYNAERCRQLHVARVLDPVSATPDMIHQEASMLLSDDASRAAATAIARDIADQPPIDAALDRFLALAA